MLSGKISGNSEGEVTS